MEEVEFIEVDGKKVVKNSLDDPNRKVVWNRLCRIHNEIFVYRPSVDPKAQVKGIIEMKWEGM